MDVSQLKDSYQAGTTTRRTARKLWNVRRETVGLLSALLFTAAFLVFHSRDTPLLPRLPWTHPSCTKPGIDPSSFYSSVNTLTADDGICVRMYGQSVSHAGYIGLKDDRPEQHRRTFFWYAQPQHHVLLTADFREGILNLRTVIWMHLLCLSSVRTPRT